MAINGKNSSFDFNERTQREVAPTVPAKPVVTRERRTKRGNLLMKPSVYDKLMNYAIANDDNFNNLVNHILEDFVKKKIDHKR